jgi:gentisate 1,2-dioxygenase
MVSLEFINPTTGGPAMPTLGCEMHRLRPNQRTPTSRKVGSSIHVVFKGAGTTVINGQSFEWSRGDVLVTPSWSAVDHLAHEPSDLFTVTDRPILEALHIYREQTLPKPQDITSAFVPK